MDSCGIPTHKIGMDRQRVVLDSRPETHAHTGDGSSFLIRWRETAPAGKVASLCGATIKDGG